MDFIQLIKDQASPLLANVSGLAEDKKVGVMDTLTDSIVGGLKDNAGSLSGLNAITKLLGGDSNVASNPITKTIQNNFVTSAVKKVGISSQLAGTISALLPAILSAIVSRVGGGKMNIGSLLGTLTGGEKGSAGGLLEGLTGKKGGLLGGLFGK